MFVVACCLFGCRVLAIVVRCLRCLFVVVCCWRRSASSLLLLVCLLLVVCCVLLSALGGYSLVCVVAC